MVASRSFITAGLELPFLKSGKTGLLVCWFSRVLISCLCHAFLLTLIFSTFVGMFLVFNFILSFQFGVTPSGAQGLLFALCSEITLGQWLGIIWGAGN